MLSERMMQDMASSLRIRVPYVHSFLSRVLYLTYEPLGCTETRRWMCPARRLGGMLWSVSAHMLPHARVCGARDHPYIHSGRMHPRNAVPTSASEEKGSTNTMERGLAGPVGCVGEAPSCAKISLSQKRFGDEEG